MLIEIEKIQVNDRIRKSFGDIEELANDIKENGLINPPVVTPEYELIAGERRLKALQMLNYKQIEVRVMAVNDAEHQLNLEISENEIRKDFSKKERIDYARRLERIERVKAEQRIKATQNNNSAKEAAKENFPRQTEEGQVRDIVAEKMGIGSGKQYEKEKFVVDNADSETLAMWDAGDISTHAAYIKIKKEKDEAEKKIKALENANSIYEKQLDEALQKVESEVDEKTEELVQKKAELEIKLRQQYEAAQKLKQQINQENSIADKYKKKIKELEEELMDAKTEIQRGNEVSIFYAFKDASDNFLFRVKKFEEYKYEQMDSEELFRFIDVVEEVEQSVANIKKAIGNIAKTKKAS